MAEASAAGAGAGAAVAAHRFFCHFCKGEVSPKLPEEDGGPQPEQNAETLRSLLHFLLQASKRPSRSPAFLFQPQRFGRNSRGPWSHNRLSARTGVEHSSPFWSLIAPQRFGKK